jgi:hypothetical protein
MRVVTENYDDDELRVVTRFLFELSDALDPGD